jgi:hypothetical protein
MLDSTSKSFQAINSVLTSDDPYLAIDKDSPIAIIFSATSQPDNISLVKFLQVYKDNKITDCIIACKTVSFLSVCPELWDYPMCIVNDEHQCVVAYILLPNKEKEDDQVRTFAQQFSQFGKVGIFCEIAG